MKVLGGIACGVCGALAMLASPAGADEPVAIAPKSASTVSVAELDRSVEALDVAVRRTPPQRKAVIISDSAMAGVRWNLALGGFRGFFADARLESCRRLVAQSCRGREGRRPNTALVEVNQLARPQPTDVLVIATGYNDWYRDFGWQSRMVLDAAQAKGFTTIAWVTYRENVTYQLPGDPADPISLYKEMNDDLDEHVASGKYPELELWDLNRYTAGAVGWFYDDGVHERRLGSWGVADWISRHMAELDGRPCAMPWSVAFGQDQSCPNPDFLPVKRGYPDLVWLYNL